MKRIAGWRWILGWLCLAATLAAAKADEASTGSALETEQRAAWEAASKVLQRGPVDIKLADQARLALPKDSVYVPPAQAGRLMRSMGNEVDGNFQGLVFLRAADGNSAFVLLTYDPSGYVKDDDAKDWKADELLEQLREGTAEGNKRRREMGVGEVEVTGWVQAPHYDAQSHQLVWCVGAREIGAPDGAAQGVNYRTLVLGREGFLSMTLVTDQAHVDGLRPAVANLLDNLQFEQGKRYADFNISTDRVAEFGLAALVAGVAAKKLGLIAILVAFVVKFAKVIVVAAAGLLFALRRKLGFKSKEAPTAPPAAATAVEPPPGTVEGTAAMAPTVASAPPAAPPPPGNATS